MTELWIGCCSRGSRRDLARALDSVSPLATLVFAADAADLRRRFEDEEPNTVGAVVGLTEDGISDVNVAAAVAHDGRASEVLLVTREASGSLRSRARQAGITRVVEIPRRVEPVREEGAPISQARGRVESDVTSARTGLGGGEARTAEVASPSAGIARPDVTSERLTPLSSSEEAVFPGGGPILCLSSGRGGVGKTTIAACCAVAAASWGMQVALVDLDLSCGDLCSRFGIGSPSDLARLGGEPTAEQMGRLGIRCAKGVSLWGPCDRPEMAERVAPVVPTLLRYLSSRHDLVVVDTSTTFCEATARAAQVADRVLLVHDGARGSLASLGRASALAVRLGVARTRMVRVQNMADPRARFEPALGRAEAGLEGARAFMVADGGEAGEELLDAGEVEDLMGERGDLAESVSYLVAQILSELGSLPDCEDARRSLEARPGRRRGLFGRRREAE